VDNVQLPILIKPGDEIFTRNCLLSGYGSLTPTNNFINSTEGRFLANTNPNPLHAVKTGIICSVVKKEQCIDTLLENALKLNLKKHENLTKASGDLILCSGQFDIDGPEYIGPCLDDRGTPLVCSKKGANGEKLERVLVANLRTGTCEFNSGREPDQRLPNLYANIFYYLDWIDQNTNDTTCFFSIV